MNIEQNKPIIIWLLTCVLLVYAMVLLGGYTRLSHSGLSIVQWNPISGIIPPLGEENWQAEFSQYQQSPEFKQVNHNMQLNFHRVLGRITGLVFFLPFLYFAIRGFFTNKETRYFAAIGALIALQGGVGWFMVKSGLVDQPNVSQYRLALHLLMACIVLMMLAWKIIPVKKNIFEMLQSLNFRASSQSSMVRYGCFSLVLLLLQIASGAFVAGLHAGLVYNSFPLMDGKLIPEGLWQIKPCYLNIFENIITVQFIHRLLAIINMLNILAYCYKILNLKINRKIAMLLASLVLLQFALGILTLLLQVPLIMGLLHQTIAIILLITMLASLKQLIRA